MNSITVKQLIDLFFDISFFNIYIIEEDETFKFDGYKYPDELKGAPISSIDDPMSYIEETPFTINISCESFADYNKFKEAHEEYIV